MTQYGQAFTYDALSKQGVRPIIYSALGGHPNYAVPGIHSREVAIILVNDTTSAGPLWDPTLSAYFYSYTPFSDENENGTFVGSEGTTPVGWLNFEGRWGDEQYPDSDPRQVNYLNASTAWEWETGPTGPLDKDLNRTDVCPSASGTPCVTLTVLPASSGSSVPVTITRTTSTQSSVPTGTGGGSSRSSSAGSTGTSTGAAATHTGAAVSLNINIGLGLWGAVVALVIL
jgi:hypothetical protein